LKSLKGFWVAVCAEIGKYWFHALNYDSLPGWSFHA